MKQGYVWVISIALVLWVAFVAAAQLDRPEVWVSSSTGEVQVVNRGVSTPIHPGVELPKDYEVVWVR